MTIGYKEKLSKYVWVDETKRNQELQGALVESLGYGVTTHNQGMRVEHI